MSLSGEVQESIKIAKTVTVTITFLTSGLKLCISDMAPFPKIFAK